jgi:hypothetical protein
MSKPEWISNLSQDKELQEKRENLILKNIENNKIQFSNLKKTIKRISKEVAGAIGKKEDSLRIVESENEIFIGYDYDYGLKEGFVFRNNGGEDSFILEKKADYSLYRLKHITDVPIQSVDITDITEEKIYEIFHILVKHRQYDEGIVFYRFYAIIQTPRERREILFAVMFFILSMYLFFGAD